MKMRRIVLNKIFLEGLILSQGNPGRAALVVAGYICLMDFRVSIMPRYKRSA
jgi:hypothetical protein